MDCIGSSHGNDCNFITGCGSTDAPASEATAPAAESTAAATTETGTEAPAADGELAADVQAIVDRGVLRVGVKMQ